MEFLSLKDFKVSVTGESWSGIGMLDGLKARSRYLGLGEFGCGLGIKMVQVFDDDSGMNGMHEDW